eukprot:scaffold1397_cov122-Isochrysis_galbana.AAC.10
MRAESPRWWRLCHSLEASPFPLSPCAMAAASCFSTRPRRSVWHTSQTPRSLTPCTCVLTTPTPPSIAGGA